MAVHSLTPQMRRRNRPSDLDLGGIDTRTRNGTILSSPRRESSDEDVIFVSSKESETATLWVEYLTGWFEKISHQQGRPVLFKVKHIPIENPILPGTEERIRNSKLQIIIVCPILLKYVHDHSEQSSLITSYFVTEKVLAMMLGVHDSHVTYDHKMSLASYSLWRKFFVKDQDVTFVGEFLGAAIGIIENSSSNPIKNDKTCFSIHPKKVKVGQNRVLALLNEPLRAEDNLEVFVDRCGEAIEISNVRRRNPYVIQFSIPERCLEVSMLVGVRILKNGSPLGMRQVKCESRLRELDQILRAHDNPLEFMCQTFGFNSEDREQLDNWMVHAFQRNVPPHFNLLSSPQGLTPCKTLTSQDVYPTLLHFAAQFGLEKLAWQLLECPGGDLACDLRNVADLTPADMAEHSGHARLAHQLRGYMQMNEFTNMYSYLKVMSESSHENMSGNEKVTSFSELEKEEGKEDYCCPRPLNESYCVPPTARPVLSCTTPTTPTSMTLPNTAPNTLIAANYSIAPTPLPVNDSIPAPPQNNLDSSLQGYLEMSPAAHKVPSTSSSRVGTPTLHRHDSFQSIKDDSHYGCYSSKRSPLIKHKEAEPQDELLEIINDFKNKIFTIDEMERLVENWRNRNDVQQSFKDKQRQLNAMREEYDRIHKKMKDEMKAHDTPFDRIKKFFGKGKKDNIKACHFEHGKRDANGFLGHRPVSSLSLHSVSSSSSSCRMSTASGCSGTSLGDSGTHSDAEDRRQQSSCGLLSYEIPPTPKPFGTKFSSSQKLALNQHNEFFGSQRTLVHDKDFCIAFPGPTPTSFSSNEISKDPKTPSTPDFLDLSEIDIPDNQKNEGAFDKTQSYANINVSQSSTTSISAPSNMCIPKDYINSDITSRPDLENLSKTLESRIKETKTTEDEKNEIGEDVIDFGTTKVPDYMNVCPANMNGKKEQAPPVPPRSECI